MKKNVLFFLSGLTILSYSCEGPEGKVGPRGINSLINTTEEPGGTNCEYGGLKVETGLDNNGSGMLEGDEVLKTDYICSVAGNSSLINIENEPAGVTCEEGGIKVDSGIDIDQDGTLDDDEIQVSKYVCNGSDANTINEVRFKLITLTGLGTSSTTGSPALPWQNLVNFEKNLFPGMTSAILVAHIETSSANASCIVDLYDVDNEVAISNSEVSTKSTDRVWVESENFLEHLPSSQTDLVVRIRTETAGVEATVWQAYLILRK